MMKKGKITKVVLPFLYDFTFIQARLYATLLVYNFKYGDLDMALTQPATFNEEWSDERIFAYLDQLPPDGENADFHVLYHAYKHMRAGDYQRLLNRFVADGRNIQATNKQGQTIHQVIAQFPRHSSEYLSVLSQFA